jgi:hypothetical protein
MEVRANDLDRLGTYRCACQGPRSAIPSPWGATLRLDALVGTRTGPEFGHDWSPGQVRPWQSIEPWASLIREFQEAQKARHDNHPTGKPGS